MIDIQITRERVAVITMNRGKVNAMNLEFCRRLVAVLDEVEQGDAVAAVMTGNPRVFSAGVDLRQLVEQGDDYLSEYLPALIGSFKKAFAFSKPLVTAISGHAIAGGCVLACCGDLRLIRHDAKIGLPELRIGVPLPSAGIEIMRFAVAPEALRAMVNAGRTHENVDAVRVGLADRLVDAESLRDAAIEAAIGLTVVPPNVFALSKRQQRAPAWRILEANEAEFGAEVSAIWHSVENRKLVEEYVHQRL